MTDISIPDEHFCECFVHVLSITNSELRQVACDTQQHSICPHDVHKKIRTLFQEHCRTKGKTAEVTPEPHWSFPAETNQCIQRWTDDARDFSTHETSVCGMFAWGSPHLRQTLVNIFMGYLDRGIKFIDKSMLGGDVDLLEDRRSLQTDLNKLCMGWGKWHEVQ